MAPVEKQTDQELTIEDPTVIEKYRIAGDVVNSKCVSYLTGVEITVIGKGLHKLDYPQ